MMGVIVFTTRLTCEASQRFFVRTCRLWSGSLDVPPALQSSSRAPLLVLAPIAELMYEHLGSSLGRRSVHKQFDARIPMEC